MIELFYWPTPNGHKITIFLEEANLEYTLKPIDIGRGDQFEPAFLKISPNNRIPALIDHAPATGEEPIAVFESGAMLLYLAEKTGKFLPTDLRERKATLEWLFWQIGGLGPMAGQNHHFNHYAADKIAYAIDRYVNETTRLYHVMDHRLGEHHYLAGDYSIADMACYPWVVPYERQGQSIAQFPHLERWFKAIAARPAVQRAYAKGEIIENDSHVIDEEAKKILFGQTDTRRPDG